MNSEKATQDGQTCEIFDGLDGLDCTNEADMYGLCERHGGYSANNPKSDGDA